MLFREDIVMQCLERGEQRLNWYTKGEVTWYPTKPCERQNEKPVPTFLSNVTVKYMIQVLQGNSVVEKNVMEHLW